jgi:DNA-binding IclR family transcriptional regulator
MVIGSISECFDTKFCLSLSNFVSKVRLSLSSIHDMLKSLVLFSLLMKRSAGTFILGFGLFPGSFNAETLIAFT